LEKELKLIKCLIAECLLLYDKDELELVSTRTDRVFGETQTDVTNIPRDLEHAQGRNLEKDF